MSQIKDYITQRIQQLEDSLVPLRQQLVVTEEKIAQIERELVDLNNAAKAIGLPNGLQIPQLKVTRRRTADITIKEAVLRVLEDHFDGLIALDLLAEINRRFDWNLVRPSLSPQLTRLKREGKIINEGSVWRLPHHPSLFLHTDKNTK